MRAFLAVCMSCDLEGPPDLLERGPDGWLICPACGSSDVAEYVASDDLEESGGMGAEAPHEGCLQRPPKAR